MTRRMEELEKNLEGLRARIAECKQGLIPLLTLDENMHLVVNPSFREEAMRYRDLDLKFALADKALKHAFQEGTKSCEQLGAPLNTPPDPLDSLNQWAAHHYSRSEVIKREVEKLHELDSRSLAMRIKDKVQLRKLQREYREHLEQMTAMREAAQRIEELYQRAEAALKDVEDLLNVLNPPRRLHAYRV